MYLSMGCCSAVGGKSRLSCRNVWTVAVSATAAVVSRETSNYSLTVWVDTALSREKNNLSHLVWAVVTPFPFFCHFFPDPSAVGSHLPGVPARLSLEKE